MVAVQPAPCADPEVVVLILQNCPDNVVTQAFGIFRIMLKMNYPFRVRIEAVQSTVKGSHPELSFMVFPYAFQFVMAQRVGVLRIMLEDPEVMTIKPVKSIFGHKPHETLTVLNNGVDNALRQALSDGIMAENRIILLGIKIP